MEKRCPTSTYQGIARLPNYRWIINSRGYANIVEASTPIPENQYPNVVFGLVYTLQTSDEANLDANEGVPYAYTKEDLEVDFWPAGNASQRIDVGDAPVKTTMLVYVDRERIVDAAPKAEYVFRMNMGIRDAVRLGVPVEYVRRVMRRFIAEKEDAGVVQVAVKQAVGFEDV